MLGTLHLIVAYFVFLSHFPQNEVKLNFGMVSVIIFYLHENNHRKIGLD